MDRGVQRITEAEGGAPTYGRAQPKHHTAVLLYRAGFTGSGQVAIDWPVCWRRDPGDAEERLFQVKPLSGVKEPSRRPRLELCSEPVISKHTRQQTRIDPDPSLRESHPLLELRLGICQVSLEWQAVVRRVIGKVLELGTPHLRAPTERRTWKEQRSYRSHGRRHRANRSVSHRVDRAKHLRRYDRVRLAQMSSTIIPVTDTLVGGYRPPPCHTHQRFGSRRG